MEGLHQPVDELSDSASSLHSAPSPEDKVTSYIESQLSSILDELCLEDGSPRITINKRSLKQASYSLNRDTGALEDTSPSRVTPHTYSWPGKTPQETWRFATILRIMGHVHEAIKGDFTSTKRDLYYLDPVHFGKQAVVDRYVDDIAFTMGVDRTALHVQAAAKGLVAGQFRIILENGATINVGDFSEVHIG
ncbi:Non-essential glycogen phosphorylase [Ascosphaera pollenicola]|nr:Non-essential glycogen phosphorylase [Ascosphaera pollenicola]